MSFDDILFEKTDGVATITINRPDKLNAFSGQTIEEMIEGNANATDTWAVLEEAVSRFGGTMANTSDSATRNDTSATGVCRKSQAKSLSQNR